MLRKLLTIFVACILLISLMGLGYSFYLKWLLQEKPLDEIVNLTKKENYKFSYQQYSNFMTVLTISVSLPELVRDRSIFGKEEYERLKNELEQTKEKIKNAKSAHQRQSLKIGLDNQMRFIKLLENRQIVDTTEIDQKLRTRYEEICRKFIDELKLKVQLKTITGEGVISKEGLYNFNTNFDPDAASQSINLLR